MTTNSTRPFPLTFNQERKTFYRRQGYWGDATLLDCWNISVLRYPEKAAVIDSHGLAMTFREVDCTATKLADYLSATGVGPGNVVSCQLPGWAEFLPIYIACLKAGCAINPLPPSLRFAEMKYILGNCGSKILFVPHSYKTFPFLEMANRLRAELACLSTVIVVDKFREESSLPAFSRIVAEHIPVPAHEGKGEPPVLSDDLAVLLFTSGSEGSPKGVMLTHNNVIASESAFAAHLNITSFDTMLMPAPVTHATGFHHGVTMPFLVGATTVLQDVFIASATLDFLEKYRCTVAMGTPSFVHDLLCELEKRPRDISSLRFFLSGGSPLSEQMMEDALQYGITLCNIYGSTESVPHIGPRPVDGLKKRANGSGVPVPGVEVKIVDKARHSVSPGQEGQEASRGPQVFMGYLGQPELTAEALDVDGWYYSGDLCIQENDGSIRVTDRLKDVIIRGGVNISSLEVENILLRHPNIREAAVVAMPDLRLIEKACAYVVLRDPSSGLDLEQLRCFLLQQEVMKQKFPERLEVVDCLPRTSTGKVCKKRLREDAASKVHQEDAKRQT